MKLRYETGIATFIQLITTSVLGFASGTYSVVSTCHSGQNDCVSNMISSIILYILTVCWFVLVWVLGFMAQDKRSKRLAQLLIGVEGLIAIVALFDIKHYGNYVSLIASLADLVLCVWIVVLAFRLMRSKGGRVVSGRSRNRQRPTPPRNPSA